MCKLLIAYYKLPTSGYLSLYKTFNYFTSRMHVSEQVWSYTFMAYIAENGGFVGLFLGLAVLRLEDVFTGVANRLKENMK